MYAPNNRNDKERVFNYTRTTYSGPADCLIVGGDFNCVQNLRRDRLRKPAEGYMSESPAFDEMCRHLDVNGALDLAVSEDNETREPHQHFTRQGKLVHPVRAANPDTIPQQLRSRVEGMWTSIHIDDRFDWDEGCTRLKADIRQARQDEKMRVREATKKTQLQQVKPKFTRKDFIAERAERAGVVDVANLVARVHSVLLPADIELDAGLVHHQAQAKVQQLPRDKQRGEHHGGTSSESSVRTPANRKVTTEWNDRLTAPIEEVEAAAAIRALLRHKAPGPDQLPNGFFADCKNVLISWLTPLFNKIKAGGPMPASFVEGLIIPLRKIGDFDNALGY
ncbi:hypothetical protein PybrP1_001413 [[Pythium] brassicae (nom. inval.)]|nr:hypothetical protein PybrP1_001413 [[Pythium] brassicae (nom. inval.)]